MLTYSSFTVTTETRQATNELGAALGRALPVGAVILLHGDLGAGKTTLTQGIARGLGITDPVQSPTFTLVGEHQVSASNGEPFMLYHIDLYRLDGEADLESIGWENYLAPDDGVVVIEWPERAGRWLPDDYLLITFDQSGPEQRRLTFSPVPTNGQMSEVLATARDELLAATRRPIDD